jgi:hypothetical protein
MENVPKTFSFLGYCVIQTMKVFEPLSPPRIRSCSGRKHNKPKLINRPAVFHGFLMSTVDRPKLFTAEHKRYSNRVS